MTFEIHIHALLNFKLYLPNPAFYYSAGWASIHVIFSWAQIGRSAIFGREIAVPDRESFSRQKKSSLMSKIVYLHQRRSL